MTFPSLAIRSTTSFVGHLVFPPSKHESIHNENGPSLYYIDPSGTLRQPNAKAMGSISKGADSSSQEQYNKELSLQEAETIARYRREGFSKQCL